MQRGIMGAAYLAAEVPTSAFSYSGDEIADFLRPIKLLIRFMIAALQREKVSCMKIEKGSSVPSAISSKTPLAEGRSNAFPLQSRLGRASAAPASIHSAHAAEAQERGVEVGVHIAVELVLRDTNTRDTLELLREGKTSLCGGLRPEEEDAEASVRRLDRSGEKLERRAPINQDHIADELAAETHCCPEGDTDSGPRSAEHNAVLVRRCLVERRS